MKKNVLFLSVLCLSLAFAACNKNGEGNNDDNSYEKFMLAPTDLEDMRLFGKVKTYSNIFWVDCVWQNNEVVPGRIRSYNKYEFNEAGYITTLTEFSYSNDELIPIYIFKYTYDANNRITMIERTINKDGATNPFSKKEYIYDDNNKTVTDNLYEFIDGEYVLTATRIYQQNKYGRMDKNNYEYINVETRSTICATKYDDYGNATEYYELKDGVVSILRTYIYEYYK